MKTELIEKGRYYVFKENTKNGYRIREERKPDGEKCKFHTVATKR